MWNKLTGKNSDAASASQSGDRDREKEKRRSKTGESSSSRSGRRAESVISSASTSRRSERERDRERDRDGDRDRDGERKSSSSANKRSSLGRTATFPPPESVASSYATAPSTREREEREERERERTPRRSATMPVGGDDAVSTYSYENVHSWDKPRERDEESVYGIDRERDERRRSERERESDSPRDREERRKERRERREAERSAPLSKRDSERKANSRSSIVEESTTRAAGEDMPGAFPGQSMGPSRPEPSYSTSDPHIAHQFPGMSMSAGTPLNPYGAAADFYGDQGQSVQYQPGVRPDTPLMNAQPHLQAASAEAMPAQDTGNGSAADYFSTGAATAGAISGAAATTSTSSSKPAKPGQGVFSSSSSSKPSKPSKTNSGSGKLSTAAAAAVGGAALGYALNSNAQESNSSLYVHGAQETATNNAYQSSIAGASSPAAGGHSHSLSAPHANTYGVGGDSDVSPRVSPSHSPSRPGKSNFGKYAAGAAGMAAGAYALHNHSHNGHAHTSSAPTGYNGYNNGYGGAAAGGPSGYTNGHSHNHNHGNSNGGAYMELRNRNTGPVSKLVDWWKDHEDVAKMEEYTEYIGVCRGCFDPNTHAYMAPRKHHYTTRKRKSTDSLRERRSAEFERGGRVSKDARYYAGGASSRYGSDEEKRRKSGGGSGKTGILAAGLGAYGLAKAGKAVFGQKGDFEDTYSVRSGRRAHSSRNSYARHGSRSRSSSRDRRSSYGVIRRRGSSSSDDGRRKGSKVDVVADGKGQYRLERKRSDRDRKGKNRSRSSSRDRRTGILGAAAGAALAGSAIAAASSRRKHHSRSRSRSHSPSNSNKNYAYVRRHRDHDDVSVYSQGTTSRHHRGFRASREDLAGTATGGGFLGGIFGGSGGGSERRRRISPKRKKKTGFFTFGNGSSSSDLGLAYGDSRRSNRSSRTSLDNSGKRRPKRKSSDEKINATLLGIGATAAALAAAQHGRGKHGAGSGSKADLFAVKEQRGGGSKGYRTRGSLVSKPARHSSDDDEDDGGVWEDDPNDSSSAEGFEDEGLAYGDWRARKSTDSLVSNDSGTWKWGWRWGRKKNKRASRESLNAGAGASSSYNNHIAPSVAAGAAAGVMAAGMMGSGYGGRYEGDGNTYSPSLSSQPSMQSVVPVMSNDPTRFDAVGRRADSLPMYSSPHQNLPLNAPQPVAPVNGAVYNTSSEGYVAPSGPPVDFTSASSATGLARRDSRDRREKQRPVSYSAADLARRQSAPVVDEEVAPQLPARRRRASSPVMQSSSSSSLGRNALIGGAAAAAGIAAASALSNSSSKQPGTPSKDVRFSFDAEQAGRERVRDREHDREARRRQDADEEAEREREKRRREEEAARAYAREEEARAASVRRDAERRAETERERRREEEARAAIAAREAERRAEAEREAARRAAAAREAEDRERLEREAERRRREREAADREAAQREADAQAAAAREAGAREEAYRAEQELRAKEAAAREEELRLERERREREAAADREFEKRENERRANWAAPVAAGAAGIAAASVISALSESSSSSRDKRKDRKKDKGKDKKRQDSIPLDSRYEVYRSEADEPSRSNVQIAEPKVIEPKPVVREIKPLIDSKVEIDDGFDDDVIFDPDYFRKARDKKRAAAEMALASKAADKVVADMKSHYDEGPVSNEDFWAPAELKDHSHDRKLNDPNADADVEVLHEGDLAMGVPPYDRDYSFKPVREVGGAGGSALWAVPQLKLIEPTPPASRANSYAGSYAGSARGSVPASPVVEPQHSSADPVGEELERQRSGSRVRWGQDQTHIYDAVTPESIREKFISDDDISPRPSPQASDEILVEETGRDGETRTQSYKPAMAATAAAAAAYGISKELVESPVEEEIPRVSPGDEERPVYRSQSPERTPVVVEPSERTSKRSGGFYEQPFFDSISDLATTVRLDEDAEDLSTTARDHGFVEGEVFDPTPKEEKDYASGMMPGGFVDDDEVEEEAAAAPVVPVTASMSKKQKKKEKKKAKNRELEMVEPESQPALAPEAESSSASASKLPAFMADAPSGFPVATGIVEAKDRDVKAARDDAAEDKMLFGESTVDEEAPVVSSKKAKKKDKKKNRKSRDMEEEEVDRDIRDIEPQQAEHPFSSAAEVATGVAAGTGFARIAAAALAREKDDQEIRDGYEKQRSTSTSGGNVNVFDFLDQGEDRTSPSPHREEEPERERNGYSKEESSSAREIDDSGYVTRYQSVPDVSEEPAEEGRYDEDDRDDVESTRSGSRKKKKRRSSRYEDDVDSPRRYAASEVGDEDKKSRRKSKLDDDYDSPRRYAASEVGDEDKKSRRRSRHEDDVDSPRRYAMSEVGDEDGGRKKRRSKRDSDFQDDVSVASTSKLYDDDRERRRRSKRDSEIRDDVSVASTSRLRDDDKRRSKDEKKDKEKKDKEKKGGLFGIFSSSKDKDDKESKKSRSSRDDDEDRERRRNKRSSRSQAGSDDEDDERRRSSKSDRSSRSVEDDGRSEKRRSRSTKDDYSIASDDIGYKHDTDHPYSRYSRQPPDDVVDDVMSHTEDVESTTSSRRSRKDRDSKDQSFLGVRAEDESAIDAAPLPASPLGDDVPSFEPPSTIPDLTVQSASPGLSREEVDTGEMELPSLPASRPTSPIDVGQAQDLPTLPDSRPGSPYEEAPRTPPRPSLESLRAASKTAVPFRFRYPNTASSPVVPREVHLPSPATTASPSTPFTPLQTPKTRHSKSLSGDLTREYRPLYLVEKTRKTPDVEDNLPPLPDSASTSRTPSVQDTDDESFHSAVQSPEASFHGSFDEPDIMFDDRHLSQEPDDLLDSQQTTPKAATFPAGVLDLPSQTDAEDRSLAVADPEETPKKSREPSPSRFGAGELAADAAVGAAAGLVAHKLLSSHDDDARSVRSEGSFKARDLDDFMGGEADEDENVDEEFKRQVEEAAKRRAEEEAELQREQARTPALSKKAAKKLKKGKRGSKSTFDEAPEELQPEPTDTQLRERDAQDAIDSWFDTPVKKGKEAKNFDDFLPTQPQDETVYRAKVIEDDDMDDASTLVGSSVTYRGPAEDIKEQVAEVSKVPDVLLQRTPSGKKGKKKGKKGSKSGSISLDKEESVIPEEAVGSAVAETIDQDKPGECEGHIDLWAVTNDG